MLTPSKALVVPARARTLLVALASVLALLAGHAPAATAKPSYVALGDSFTAGPVIPLQIPPLGCLKSDHNYPHLAAPDLRPPTFRDASCSGAKTDHMTRQQNVEPGPNPPQFDSLDADTRIVSVGIGGNDIGFTEILRNCSSSSPQGQPCQDRYVSGANDEISERIKDTAPKIAAVLQGIHARSPKAAVYVVSYLPILPEPDQDLAADGPGCYPQIPVAYADVPYLRDKQKELNQMLADQAAGNNASLVDAYSAGIGHDACQLPSVRWVEPSAPAAPAAPYHPNLDGMQGTSRALKATVGSK